MVRVEKPVETYALPVDSQCILRQIIRTDREKVHLTRQLDAHHDGGRCLDHNAKLDLVRHRHALFREFRANVAADALNLLHLPDRRNHREHDRDLAVSRRAVQRAQLRAEHLGTGQTDADGTQTHRRIFLFVEVEIVGLLVRTDVQRSDDNAPAAHALRDCLICLKLLILGWVVAAL